MGGEGVALLIISRLGEMTSSCKFASLLTGKHMCDVLIGTDFFLLNRISIDTVRSYSSMFMVQFSA